MELDEAQPSSGGPSERKDDSESESEMNPPKMKKRISSVAEIITAFRYRSPGTQTRLNCSLTAVASPERITSEMVQCAREGDNELLEAILRGLGKDVEKIVNLLDENKLSPLHYAAQYNHPKIIDLLLKYKADVNIKGDEDSTPAHYSALPSRGKKPGTDRRYTHQMDQAWTSSSCVPVLKSAGAEFHVKDIYGQTPLHYAAVQGNLIAVRDILAFCDTNLIEAQDNQQMRALHVAALYNELGAAKLLLESNAEIRSRDHEQCTPLHHACAEGILQLVTLMFQLGEKRGTAKMMANDPDCEGNTCFHSAVEHGHVEVTALCIEKGCNVNRPRDDGMYPLHLAVISGKTEIVRHLANKGASIDAGNAVQATALHMAAQYNRVKAAKLLLRRGANIECPDRDNDTPLLIAAMYGHADMVQMLVEKGADVAATNLKEKTAIYVAAEEGSVEVLRTLLERPEAQQLVNWADRDGNTPLHIAAQNRNLLVVKTLLENKASIRSKNELEESPLHWAARYGNTNTIREIIKYSQKAVFAEDEKSNTPLHFAALYGHARSVAALLELGADVAQKNCVSWTALDMAASQGWKDTCTVLLEADAPIDPTDKRNTTPLHLACSHGHFPVVELLLRWHANVTLKNRDGMNCLDLAIENNNSDVARLIIQSDKWKDALRHFSVEKRRRNGVIIDTPMRRLIRKMPEVAKEVFDRCITPGEERNPLEEDFEQIYNFEFLDDLYAGWTRPTRAVDEPTSITYKGIKKKLYRKMNKLMPYTFEPSTVKNNHPLMIMVNSNKEHLLSHPLVTALISHKWWSFGAWFHISSFLLHVLFVILLTTYAMQTKPPYEFNAAESAAIDSAMGSGNCSGIDPIKTPMQSDVRGWLLAIVSLCFVSELFQVYQSKLSYFSFNNVVEWTAYIFTILAVAVNFNDCDTGYRMDWQWSLVAVAVFLAWMDLMLFVQAFTSLGIYVVMFKDILATFLKAISVFSVLIIAFALSFHLLLKNQNPFQDVGNSLVKMLVMTIGEYDYTDIMHGTGSDQAYLPAVTYILFTVFVILSSIVLMNLLVGLAVDDIKGILRQAALKRMAMQVGLTLDVEKILPDIIRQRFYVLAKSVYPNHKSNNPIWWIYEFLGTWWTTDPEQDEDAVLRDIPKIRKSQEAMKKEIKEIKRIVNTVRDMHAQNKRIESMLRAILKHSDDISWLEEDFSTDDEISILSTMNNL